MTVQALDQLTARLQAKLMLPPPLERRALRTAAGASLRDVASVVGVSAQAVYLWETGARMPSAAHLERYAEVLRAFAELPSMCEPDLSRAQDSHIGSSDGER